MNARQLFVLACGLSAAAGIYFYCPWQLQIRDRVPNTGGLWEGPVLIGTHDQVTAWRWDDPSATVARAEGRTCHAWIEDEKLCSCCAVCLFATLILLRWLSKVDQGRIAMAAESP